MKCASTNISTIAELGLHKVLNVITACSSRTEIAHFLKRRNNFKTCKLAKSRLEKNTCIFLFLKNNQNDQTCTSFNRFFEDFFRLSTSEFRAHLKALKSESLTSFPSTRIIRSYFLQEEKCARNITINLIVPIEWVWERQGHYLNMVWYLLVLIIQENETDGRTEYNAML